MNFPDRLERAFAEVAGSLGFRRGPRAVCCHGDSASHSPVETRSVEAVDIRVRLRRPGLGREARWRGGAGGRLPAVRASAVRGPGCPCLPGGRWRCSRRVIPGRGTSLLGTAPPRLFAQAQSSDLRPAVWEPGAAPSPPARSTLGCRTPLLAAPPPRPVCAGAGV